LSAHRNTERVRATPLPIFADITGYEREHVSHNAIDVGFITGLEVHVDCQSGMSDLGRLPFVEELAVSQSRPGQANGCSIGIRRPRDVNLAEEFPQNVPKSLLARKGCGLPPDEVADALAEGWPWLGLTTENELYQRLNSLAD
jgi:hypothetical protein